MAEGKKIEDLSDKEREDMKNKAKVQPFSGVVRTRFMTLRLEEIAAISRDEPSAQQNGGSLILVFKSGAQQNLKYNDLNERDKDYQNIDNAMSHNSMTKPTENLD